MYPRILYILIIFGVLCAKWIKFIRPRFFNVYDSYNSLNTSVNSVYCKIILSLSYITKIPKSLPNLAMRYRGNINTSVSFLCLVLFDCWGISGYSGNVRIFL